MQCAALTAALTAKGAALVAQQEAAEEAQMQVDVLREKAKVCVGGGLGRSQLMCPSSEVLDHGRKRARDRTGRVEFACTSAGQGQ